MVGADGVHDRTANVIVVNVVGVAGYQNLQVVLCQGGLQLAGVVGLNLLLCLFGQQIGIEDLLLFEAQLFAQFGKGLHLAAAAAHCNVAGNQAHILGAEGVIHHIGQRPEFQAELLVTSHIRHAGHKDQIALSDQPGHMSQVDLGRKAAFINGIVDAALQNSPVGFGADHHFTSQ